MSIKKPTTKVDYTGGIKTNEEIGGEYSKQLYNFLRDDFNPEESKELSTYCTYNTRNKAEDKIIISCYERKMAELGLKPNTAEIIKAAEHDNEAVFWRYMSKKPILPQLFYNLFKPVTHIIEHKSKYMGKEIDLKEVKEYDFKFTNLKDSKGKITGIGKNSICLQDTKGKKHYFWYLPAPLSYSNTSSHGAELAVYIINKYGE